MAINFYLPFPVLNRPYRAHGLKKKDKKKNYMGELVIVLKNEGIGVVGFENNRKWNNKC